MIESLCRVRSGRAGELGALMYVAVGQLGDACSWGRVLVVGG